MAKHGTRKQQKRISLPKAVDIERKEFNWATKSSPGPHNFSESIPLSIALRDLLGTARNKHEVKIILNKRVVSVDGVIRNSHKFPLGLFDVIGFSDLKKHYRVLPDEKGRFMLKEIPAKSAGFKLVQVTGKKAAKGKKIQLNSNDGRVFIVDAKQKAGIGDTLKISLPEQKITETFALEKGNTGFVFSGKRIGVIAEITQVLPGTMKRGKLVLLKPRKGEEFQTVAENIFVVGKDKPELELE